jgi:hypothetical protein
MCRWKAVLNNPNRSTGVQFAEGNGVPEDYVEAVKLYLVAAEKATQPSNNLACL